MPKDKASVEDPETMDTPDGRVVVPGAHREAEGDAEGLGPEGWAEVPADRIGPATNVRGRKRRETEATDLE